jgi:hypothetical protein
LADLLGSTRKNNFASAELIVIEADLHTLQLGQHGKEQTF